MSLGDNGHITKLYLNTFIYQQGKNSSMARVMGTSYSLTWLPQKTNIEIPGHVLLIYMLKHMRKLNYTAK